MTEHTTIQITREQADELEAHKTHENESYKSVIARLLNGDNSATTDAQAIADAVAEQIDTNDTMQADIADVLSRLDDMESQLPRKVADEFQQ